jgi:hypothetical protein
MKAQWNCCKETGVQRPNQVPSAGIMVNSKCEATSAVITKCPGKQPGKITGPMLNLVDQICTHILAIGIKENLELTSLTTHKLIHATFEGSHSPWSCKCKKDCSFLVDYPRGGRFDPSICPTMPVTCQYLATQRSMQLFSPTFRSASLYLQTQKKKSSFKSEKQRKKQF